MLRRTYSQNLAQNQPSKSQHQTEDSDLPQRPEKEKVAKHTEVGLAQEVSRQALLEGMVEETNQAIHTIKQLLEGMVIPLGQPTPRLRSAIKGS